MGPKIVLSRKSLIDYYMCLHWHDLWM